MNPIQRYLRSTMNPAWYHGHGRRGPFFEGWYYKCIDAAAAHKWAIIPGVFLGTDPHAFIQVLDGRSHRAWYHRYPLAAFWASPDSFAVHVEESRFSDWMIDLNIAQPEQTIRGRLAFSQPQPWPVTLRSPGIMGWYAWVPTMECYHGVLSFDHAIQGKLEIDGETAVFDGGRGYIEKDWGRSFPSAWIWMQTNHFSQPGTSLTASIAMIPWQFTRFRGFIVGLWHEQRLYRFATYTGAETTELIVDDHEVHWVLRGKTAGADHELQLRAMRAEAGILAGPSTVDMGRRVAESLTAAVAVQLVRREDGRERLLFSDTGQHAGLEVTNVPELLAGG
jgi:tocopherol cyclase